MVGGGRKEEWKMGQARAKNYKWQLQTQIEDLEEAFHFCNRILMASSFEVALPSAFEKEKKK